MLHFPFPDTTHLAIVLVNRPIMQHVIAESKHFFMDGTFRIAPKQGRILSVRSSQIFNIFADFHDNAALLFTVIMTSRKLPLYEKVMDIIKENFPDFKPIQMMSDFETAMRKSFKSRFPNSRLFGCRLAKQFSIVFDAKN